MSLYDTLGELCENEGHEEALETVNRWLINLDEMAEGGNTAERTAVAVLKAALKPALDNLNPNPRERGDDDGVEYADPRGDC